MPKHMKIKVNVKDRVEDNVLDLSLSELIEVPIKDIASFKRITVLDLSNNKLTALGKTFPTLINIVKLDLSKNQIKFLPDEFGNLRNLTHLDLYSNRLEHLPLSFGNLKNLRYLDLKANPLTPALSKVVGLCATTKDCNVSAKNTVNCMARMQEELKKAKEQLEKQEIEQIKSRDSNEKSELKIRKKTKKSQNQLNNIRKEIVFQKRNAKINSIRAASEGYFTSKMGARSSSTALKTIFCFFVLLVINIFVIYIIMFKNPEIAEKLVELIPHQYRNWILTKSEYFQLCFSDWVQYFRTPVRK